MNPFSQALLAYHNGDLSADILIRRDDGYQDRVPISVFFEEKEFSSLETRALGLCAGKVLDVGAGAGRHSLPLIRSGFDVTSLDILPEMESILRDRGAQRVVISDVMTFNRGRFDTVLMLMNGIGMVGTIEALTIFLRQAHRIVTAKGQILCDSVDVSATSDPIHVSYRNQNADRGRPLGQQMLSIEYNGITGTAFPWLHIDFKSLTEVSQEAGWNSELIAQDEGGHYLCRLTKNNGQQHSQGQSVSSSQITRAAASFLLRPAG